MASKLSRMLAKTGGSGKRTKAAISADKNVKAKHPGKRVSASGNRYTENRANRSDVNRTKKFAGGGIPSERFTEDAMERVINEDNFNDAIFLVQTEIGQDDGGTAGIHFSGYDEDENGDILDWKEKDKRRQIIKDYLETEDVYYKAGGNSYAEGGKITGEKRKVEGIEYDVVDGSVDYHSMKKISGIPMFNEGYSDGKYGYVQSGYDWLRFDLKKNKFAKGGGVSKDGDRHKYYLKVYFTKNDYDNKKPTHTTSEKVNWDKAKEAQDTFLDDKEHNYYAVEIVAAKDGRVVSTSSLFADGGTVAEKFKVVDGTSYHADTPDKVINILEESRKNKTRLILDYGDRTTGQSWGERYDIKGHIGRSTGEVKIPLLIYNARSMGGGGVLDNSIVKISAAKGGRVLYQHPDYKPAGTFAAGGVVNHDDLPQTVYSAIADIEPNFSLTGKIEIKENADYSFSLIDGKGKKMTVRNQNGASPENTIYKYCSANFAAKSAGNDFDDETKYDDPIAAREIELYAENNSSLYSQRWIPIINNLKRKKNKGTFDVKKAAVLMKYYVEDADKRYNKEHGDRNAKGYILSVNDRKLLAAKLAHYVEGMTDADMTFAKGGKAGENIEELFDKAITEGQEMIEELMGEDLGGYEAAYTRTAELVETKSRDGFIPFTDGGVDVRFFEHISHLMASGTRLPTNTLQAEMERLDDNAQKEAVERFKKEYPHIVEAIGEDKINYNDLQDEGYSNEADELDQFKSDWLDDETILFEIGFLLYMPENSRSINGKPTCVVHGLVNLEAPYHRQGKGEDFIETSFNFTNLEGFKKKLKVELDKIEKWFNREYYDNGRTIKYREGGTVDYAPLPNEFAKGGVARITNGEAKDYSENRLPFKGANLEGKELDNGDYVVLSYGHYPIWYYNKKEEKWYTNSDKYSATTSKQTSQSRPTWEAVPLSHSELTQKMLTEYAHFDLGGLMLVTQNPMTIDNTLAAHAGSPVSSQAASGV